MKINSLDNTYLYQNKRYTNFKKSDSGIPKTIPHTFSKAEKGTAAGGGLLLAAAGIFTVVKNKKIAPLFNKIFRPYKNMFMEHTEFKDVNIRTWTRKIFQKGFIDNIKNPQYKILANGSKQRNLHPNNGCLVYGPDSRAKKDHFEWMLEELKNAGVEIIEPKPGQKPKFDEVAKSWNKLWFDETTPEKVAEQFKKDGKYKAFVVRGVDEIGEPSWHKSTCKPHKYPENLILNDAPNTDSSVEKFGVMLIYEATNPSKLCNATIRAGRVNLRATIMPYADESLELWKDYLNSTRSGCDPAVVTRTIAQAKEELAGRGEAVMKEMEPYFVYDVPYQGLIFKDPLKKWKNWIEYTGNRKGVSEAAKIEEFRQQIESIAATNRTFESKGFREALTQKPKFIKINEMMKEKVKSFAPTYEYWDKCVEATLKGIYNNLI